MTFSLIDRDNPELWAIRVNGKGNVTETTGMEEFRSMPQRCSPSFEGLLYLVNREGIASCLEAETGELVWRERLPGRYSASPIYLNDRIYFLTKIRKHTSSDPVENLKVRNQFSLSRSTLASPAVDGDS